jgi:hypothetical protein
MMKYTSKVKRRWVVRTFWVHQQTSTGPAPFTPKMALPVASNIHINYETERGMRHLPVLYYCWLIFASGRIRDFLSKFKGGQEKDFTLDFANIDLRDGNDPQRDESTSLKYIQQLVRVVTRFESRKTRLSFKFSNGSRIVNNKCLSLTWKIFLL